MIFLYDFFSQHAWLVKYVRLNDAPTHFIFSDQNSCFEEGNLIRKKHSFFLDTFWFMLTNFF